MSTALGFVFDANHVKPGGVPEALDNGWYNSKIIEAVVKPTKAQDGAYLNVTEEILDGVYAGRKVIARLNMWNPNPVAAEIGWGELSAICHATGVMQLSDYTQLYHIPHMIRIEKKPGRVVRNPDGTVQEYPPNNDVKEWAAYGARTAGPTTPMTGIPGMPGAGFMPPGAGAQPGPQLTPGMPGGPPAAPQPTYTPPPGAPALTPPVQPGAQPQQPTGVPTFTPPGAPSGYTPPGMPNQGAPGAHAPSPTPPWSS